MIYRDGMPFAFWCHKVLPLVYDESLSYYEFLCKLAKILQEVMEHDVEQDELIQKCIDDITQILSDIESINGEIADIKDKNIEQDNAIRELGETCAQLREDITQLADDIGEINHAIAGINDEIDDINDKNDEQDGAIRGLGDDISTLRHDMETAVDDLEERVRNIVLDEGDIWDAIAPPFQNYEGITRMLPKGSVVRYEGELYVTNTDVTIDHVIDVPPENTDFYGSNVAYELLSAQNAVKGMGYNLANEYDYSLTYNGGDYCMHENVLYKCNDNNVTGSWDSTKWNRVRVTNEMGQGGGGNGNVVVPDWDSTVTYPKYAFVNYNNVLYMSMGAQLGDTPPTNWVAINPIDIDSDSFRILNVTQDMEYYGAGGYEENDLCLYRESNGGMFLKKALTSTSGTFDPSVWIDTDFLSEFALLRSAVYGTGVDTYDSTKVYNTGDIVIHIDKIMVCTADGVTGAYDFHYWTQTTIFDALAKVINKTINLNLYNGNIVNRFSTNVTEGV